MIDISKGRYWDKPWSLVDGCTPCSPGCDHCWSMAMAKRFHKWPDKVTPRPDRLDIPLRTRKPTVFAVWNDLFHEDVPDEFVDRVHAVMLACKTLENVPRHTFLVLTKRSDRMAAYYSANHSDLVKRWAEAGNGIVMMDDEDMYFSEYIMGLTCHDWDEDGYNRNNSEYEPWTYLSNVGPNVWHGCTICNQPEADDKIIDLLKVPGKHFLSIEPMLGEIWLPASSISSLPTGGISSNGGYCPGTVLRRIDLVIVGAETGPGARLLHPDWVRSVRNQCIAAGVPFYLKYMNKKDGRVLDGQTHDALPWRNENLMVFPDSATHLQYHRENGQEHNELPWRTA